MRLEGGGPGNAMLPHGVDLTLAELQDMASRQQQQIEAQQQLLVAKEQRLRFLKQQELRHEQIAAENERLRKLREKVEAQELKLKKLRALRGQVSEHKGNNNNLTAELEMIKGLFNEKEKELAMAVSKVEELTTQLEEIRNGRVNGLHSGDNRNNSPAFLELEKLRKELMMRNKLNEAQNSKLALHRETMIERKEDLSKMDIRIAELQQRLRKNRSIQLQNQHQQHHGGFNSQRGGSLNAKIGNRPISANIAAVEPYIKHGSNKDSLDQDQAYTISKNDPKYQTLPPNIKLLGPDGKQLDGEPNSGYYHEYGRTDNGHYEKNNNNNQDLKQEKREISVPSSPSKNAKDLLSKETVHKVPEFKPSKGHATAFEAMEETLKKSTGRNIPPSSSRPVPGGQNAGYKPTNLSNFTAKPFGSTYSTAKMVNRGNSVTTQPNTSSNVVNTSSMISSPGAYFPKTSTPIQSNGGYSLIQNQNEGREIFITGAPSSSSSYNTPSATSQGRQPLYTTAAGQPGGLPPPPANTNYSPLTIATNHPAANASSPHDQVSPRSRTQDGGFSIIPPPPQYQIASSRPQEPHQPQLASDAPSPNSSPNKPQNHNNRQSPGLPLSPSRSLGYSRPNQPTPTNHLHPPNNANSGRPSPLPPTPSVKSPTPDVQEALKETSQASRSESIYSSSIPSTAKAPQSSTYGNLQPKQHETDTKKDITSSSVSSALSVLMSGSTTSTTTTTRPFRYAPKSVIANTYMRKLGGNTLDEYRKTMNQLYKDFPPVTAGGSKTSIDDNSKQPSNNAHTTSQEPGSANVRPNDRYSPHFSVDQDGGQLSNHGSWDSEAMQQGQNSSTTQPMPNSSGSSSSADPQSDPNAIYHSGPPPYRGAPAYDIDTEKMRYKTNTPKTLRRRLSAGESDDLARFTPKSSEEANSSSSSPSEANKVGSHNSQNIVRVDTIQDSYDNNEDINQSPQPSSLPISYDIPQVDGEESSSSPTGPPPPPTTTTAPPSSSSSSQAKPESKPAVIRRKKTNLKAKGSVSRLSRRVSFDPLALLLDASLEGELELVQRTASEVTDPSQANDEGITALHNAICAGHFDIVKFLSEFGCNVNAPDSDGWTPLHCAASCNNLAMVRLLVEHGACIFATTISDHETAAEKCEEDEDGYDGCSEYLYSIQEKLGIINKGVVFAVFDYRAQNPDELSFHNGDGLIVLRKGDDQEKDWWWARVGDREGYIPRNLLGLLPRVPLMSMTDTNGKNGS